MDLPYLNLSVMASNATIAIDNYLLGITDETGHKDIKLLSERLYEYSTNANGWIIMEDVVRADRKKDTLGETLQGNIKLQTWLFAKDLETLLELSTKRRRELREACLELSRQARHQFNRYISSRSFAA